MVLKSLGKKLKSIGKSKPTKGEETAPPRPTVGTPEGGIGGNAMPLHGWKEGKPGKKGETGPKIGLKGEDKKVLPPKGEAKSNAPKWVKGGKSDKDKGPVVIGSGRGKWKPGDKGAPPEKGPVVIGKGRGPKDKEVESGPPLVSAPEKVTETKKVTEPEKVSETNKGGPQNPYTSTSPNANPYLVKNTGSEESDVSDSQVSGEEASDVETVGATPASNYSTMVPPGSNYSTMAPPGSNYSRMGERLSFMDSYSQSDTSSSVDEPSPDEESVEEPQPGEHRKYKSVGTSAFEHSDPNAPAEVKVEGGEQPVEESKNSSDSNVSGEEGLAFAPMAMSYINKDGQPIVEEGNEGPKNDAPGGEQQGNTNYKNKYLVQGGEEGGYAPKGEQQGNTNYKNKYLVGGGEEGGYAPKGEQQGNTNYKNKYLVQGGEEGNDAPQEEGNTNYKNKYLGAGDDGAGNYQDLQGGVQGGEGYAKQGYLPNMAGLGSEQSRQLLSISSSDDNLSFSTSESVQSVQSKPPEPGKNAAPDVQGVTAPSKDDKVAKMQESLRKNTKNNVDPDEKTHGRDVKVTRGGLSKNEKGSQGWGLLPMRDNYRNRREVGGKITKGLDRDLLSQGQATQYFTSRGEELEYEARKVLASNLKAGRAKKREDFVIRFAGGKWVGADNNEVDTTHVAALNYSINEFREKLKGKVSSFQGLDKKLEKLQGQLKGINSNMATQQETMRKMGMAGRYIFVMNSAGEFFAGESMTGVVHHSSFLAGGAVAAAGEVAISGGTMSAISNVSGHYRPGPVYLWQAVQQLSMLGVPLDGLRVDVMGVNKNFKNASEFLGAMDPASNPLLFDAKVAIDHLNKYFAEKTKNKVKEEETVKQGEEKKDEDKSLTGPK